MAVLSPPRGARSTRRNRLPYSFSRRCPKAVQWCRPASEGASIVRGSHILRRLVMVAIPATGLLLGQVAAAASGSFIGPLTHVTSLGSTVPHNGDVNPYGMAVVTQDSGRLDAGNVLVSNFNASSNAQGTGTTIVQMTPSGGRSIFAHIRSEDVRGRCTGGVGLTTA